MKTSQNLTFRPPNLPHALIDQITTKPDTFRLSSDFIRKYPLFPFSDVIAFVAVSIDNESHD